jgi:hypothetical protein
MFHWYLTYTLIVSGGTFQTTTHTGTDYYDCKRLANVVNVTITNIVPSKTQCFKRYISEGDMK